MDWKILFCCKLFNIWQSRTQERLACMTKRKSASSTVRIRTWWNCTDDWLRSLPNEKWTVEWWTVLFRYPFFHLLQQKNTGLKEACSTSSHPFVHWLYVHVQALVGWHGWSMTSIHLWGGMPTSPNSCGLALYFTHPIGSMFNCKLHKSQELEHVQPLNKGVRWGRATSFNPIFPVAAGGRVCNGTAQFTQHFTSHLATNATIHTAPPCPDSDCAASWLPLAHACKSLLSPRLSHAEGLITRQHFPAQILPV